MKHFFFKYHYLLVKNIFLNWKLKRTMKSFRICPQVLVNELKLRDQNYLVLLFFRILLLKAKAYVFNLL